DLRVLHRLDDDVVAEPVDADLADLLRRCRGGHGAKRQRSERRDEHVPHRNLQKCLRLTWVLAGGVARPAGAARHHGPFSPTPLTLYQAYEAAFPDARLDSREDRVR